MGEVYCLMLLVAVLHTSHSVLTWGAFRLSATQISEPCTWGQGNQCQVTPSRARYENHASCCEGRKLKFGSCQQPCISPLSWRTLSSTICGILHEAQTLLHNRISSAGEGPTHLRHHHSIRLLFEGIIRGLAKRKGAHLQRSLRGKVKPLEKLD